MPATGVLRATQNAERAGNESTDQSCPGRPGSSIVRVLGHAMGTDRVRRQASAQLTEAYRAIAVATANDVSFGRLFWLTARNRAIRLVGEIASV